VYVRPAESESTVIAELVPVAVRVAPPLVATHRTLYFGVVNALPFVAPLLKL